MSTGVFRRILTQISNNVSPYTSLADMYPRLPRSTVRSQERGTKIWRPMILPRPGKGEGAFRRIVHEKDHYTVEPLNVTNLAGRDPYTGRVVAMGIGGGIKHKYHQIKWIREAPTEGPPKEEKVLEVFKDGCRTGFVALVGSGDELIYILATANMKPGDIIKTSRKIPRLPVKCKEGDSYPLGALPIGTVVCCIEKFPGQGAFYIRSAGGKGTIMRKDEGDRIVVRMSSKKAKEFSFDAHCLATVGQISNVDHGITPIGSAQRNRELGNRPRSGLWQRKDGRYGRKIKRPKPLKKIQPVSESNFTKITFSLSGM